MSILFSLGSNGSGQLGIAHSEDVSVPKQAIFHPDPPPDPVVQVAAGGNHTLLLTESWHLYWSGDPSSGACGLTAGGAVTDKHVFQPVRLSDDDPPSGVSGVAQIAATWEASFVVRRDSTTGKANRLYSFGAGNKGELGHGEMLVRSASANLFKDMIPDDDTYIVDVSACMSHVVVVLSNGDAYAWGNGRKGQAGMPEGVLHEPRKIEGVGFKVARAVCGKEFTCLFGEPRTGSLAILGSDKWAVGSTAPDTVKGWKDVGASWGSVFVLNDDGSLISWGRDDHGQLAPPDLPKLSKIAVGSEHVLALSEEGDVLAWGWGEHGNCGPKVENNDVKGRWNVIASSRFIPSGSQITSIGAGCATSWVCISLG